MRIMTRSITTAAAVYGFAVTGVHAQAAHPNFTGTWTMDAARSSASTDLPKSVTWVLAQHGDTLIADRETVVEGMDPIKSHIVVGIDGKTWKNTVAQPGYGDVETSSVASWDKQVLVIVASGNIQGTDFVQTDRWTFAADGKSFTSVRSVTVEGNEVQSASFTMVKKP